MSAFELATEVAVVAVAAAAAAAAAVSSSARAALPGAISRRTASTQCRREKEVFLHNDVAHTLMRTWMHAL